MNPDAISRRDFLAAPALAAPESRHRPNLVLFMPETLRADSVGCYGHPLVKTPNMDGLARQGVRFEQAHVQNTVCGPSRCSLMTGWPVHVRGHRSLYYFLRPDEPHLFQYLKRNGYDVYWYGKNDLLAPEAFPDSVTEWGPRPARGKPKGNPWPLEDRRYYSFLYGEGGDRRETADWAQIEAAIRVLERREQVNPFCIYLPLSMVHPPFTAPRDFHGMYDPAKVPPLRPADLVRKPNYYGGIRRTRRLDKMMEADFRQIRAIYLGMVSYTDWMLGELMAAIDRTGHANDTALFLFSDHGEWAGDYGLVEKWPSACDDILTRVPVIARVPGARAGHVSREIIELYDIMATCLDLAGIPAAHTHFGRSLLPQLRGAPGDPGRAAFCEGGYNVNEPQCFEPMAAAATEDNIYYPKVKLQNEQPETITRATMVRTLDSKLVLRPDGESEFYDLAHDPEELHNIYDERSCATRQQHLEKRLLDWYVRTADVAPRQHDPRGFPPMRRG